MPAIFSGETTSTGLSVLIILAKATLVLIAALGVTRVLERGSAVSRHLVWFVALAAILLVPALASWGPIRLAILPSVTEAPVGTGALGAPTVGEPTEIAAPSTPAPSISISPNVEATVSTVRDIVSPDTRWYGILSDPVVLFWIWATVAVLFAFWLAWGAFMVHRIVRRSRPLDTPEWQNPLYEVADRLELDEAPRLVRSEDAKMPFACGLLRPTIVLPAECDGWTLDRRRAVLLHELAHVRRRDLVGHTVGRFACALYWFHPLVWTAAKRLRSESERACDDLALNCGARASDYAEHLLDIVTGVRHHATPAVALAMARRKEFEGRMLAILDPELRRSAPSRKQTVGLVGALAVMSLVVGAAAPVPAGAGDERYVAFDSVGAQTDNGPSTDSGAFLDRTIAKAVHTVEQKELSDSIRRRRGEVGSKVGSEVGSKVGSAVGTEIGSALGRMVGDIAGTAVREVVKESTKASTIEELAAAINAEQPAQGRSDERPAMLANVLRTDTSAALRRVAAWGLANFADRDVAAEALTRAVTSDRDESVREMAAWSLSDARGTEAVIEALSTALRRDANPKVRASAAWALGNVGDEEAVEALAAALADTSRGVKVRAAWALGNVEPNSAPRALVNLLSDADADVRKVAAWALFQIEDPATVPALDSAMRREKDKDTQRAIIRAIAAMGEHSVDAIKSLIDSNDPDVRATAIRALAGGGASGPWPWPWPDPRPHP
jgi:beta-lactamase regulating signal transducer with metallopeptidase domain/HEAT repeat protein